MCTYFIIESDVSAVNTIKKVMSSLDSYHCIGVNAVHEHALNTVLVEKPPLVFINIDGNVEDPFSLVKDTNIYGDGLVDFIAISAQKNRAYDALKAGFCEFLLNPMRDLEIRKAILNFQKKKLGYRKRNICLKSYNDCQYLDTDDIIFLRGDNNTTEFHMTYGGIVHSYKTLKTFESRLPKEFLRIHKSYIINRRFVSSIQYSRSKFSLKGKNIKIPFTDTYLENVKYINRELSKFTFVPSIN